MKKYLLLLVLLFFFLYGMANADFYKWEDENGIMQITDYPPPQDKSAKDVQIHKYESDNLTDLQNAEEEESPSKDNKSKPQKNRGSRPLYQE
jgi:hypothetical protein